MNTRRNFLQLSAAATLGLIVSGCTTKEVPLDYGTPTPGLSMLDDEGLATIKQTGFARLRFTQFPTDPALFGMPPDAVLGRMISADDGMPPLTIEMEFPGETITVRTGVMILSQFSDGTITAVRWITAHDSIDAVRDTLLDQAPLYGFIPKEIHAWHRSETPSPSGGTGITAGRGPLGAPVDVKAVHSSSSVNLWYIVSLDSERATPDDLEYLLSYPKADVLHTTPRRSNPPGPPEPRTFGPGR